MRIRHAIAVVGAITLGLSGIVALPAQAAPASVWHVGVYNPSGRALSQAAAAQAPGALAQMQFTTTPDTALLLTTQGSQRGSLLGDITGKTVTATFTIAGTGTDFTYYGEPDGCGTAPSARLFFETSTPGSFAETDYWWSNPASTTLADGTLTVSATVEGANWSDYYGHFGIDDPHAGDYAAGFAAAAANVTGIGLSFGGGCFFENGVGAPDASLTLTGFTVN